MPKVPKIAETDADLARALGVTDRTVRNWKKRGIPTRSGGGYDVDAVAVWATDLRSRGRDRSVGAEPVRFRPRAPDEDDEPPAAERSKPDRADVRSDGGRGIHSRDPLREARTKREQIRAAIDGFELRIKRGEFVSRAKVDDMLASRMIGFRRELRTAGRRLAHELVDRRDPAEIQAIVERELDRILWSAYGRPAAELGTDTPKRDEEDDDGDDDLSAPDT